MPVWEKVSHISFSARDKDSCAAWFIRTLDFQLLDHVEGEGWRGVLLLHRASATIIESQHTPIVDREYGSVLTFRDPDGRQFEMFYRQDHP